MEEKETNKTESVVEQESAAEQDAEKEDHTLQDDPATLAEVEQIIEFYKDKPFDETGEEISEIETEDNGVKVKLRKKFDGLVGRFVKKSSVETNSENDGEELHDSSYGMDKRSRMILTYVITAVICGVIIGGAFLLSSILPGDEEETAKYADELRAKEDYTTLKSDYDELKTATDELRASVETKKEQSENIDDYENTQAELRSQVDSKKKELDSVNTQIAEKQSSLNSINDQIAAKSDNITTLPPGRYVVGTDIAAGKYTVTGTGAFAVAAEDKTSKYNMTLGSSPVDVTLNHGDKLKFDGTVKFTPLK